MYPYPLVLSDLKISIILIALHYNFYRRLLINIKSIKGQSIKIFISLLSFIYNIGENTSSYLLIL